MTVCNEGPNTGGGSYGSGAQDPQIIRCGTAHSLQEFKLVVHVLSDPQVYIPLRPIPEVGSTGWGRHLRKIFKEGLPLCGRRLPWWVLIDLVILLEIALAFLQTCVFVSPLGGKFNDQPLVPGSVWFRLLTCTTVIFFLDARMIPGSTFGRVLEKH